MNLYNPPHGKAAIFELVLAETWAASAKAEGQRKRLPDFPPRPQRVYVPTQDDRAAVLSALRIGKEYAGQIEAFTGLARKVVSATLRGMINDGTVIAKRASNGALQRHILVQQ